MGAAFTYIYSVDPKSILMKKAYFIIFLMFALAVSAQEMQEDSSAEQTETSDFKLYPNPASGDVVHIITKTNQGKEITVFDVFGKAVLRDRILTGTLNISRLDPGVYVLQVRESNKTMTRKLVVK